jgi:cytochrome P450
MRTVPVLTFDTADEGFVREPWPRYEEIRRLGGVVYNERVNRWMVSDFEPVRRILVTPTKFGSEKGQVEQADVFGGPTMEFYDGPHHDDIRSIWSDDFRPKTLGKLRPVITELVRARLNPVLDRLRAGATVEAVSELTRGIPHCGHRAHARHRAGHGGPVLGVERRDGRLGGGVHESRGART